MDKYIIRKKVRQVSSSSESTNADDPDSVDNDIDDAEIEPETDTDIRRKRRVSSSSESTNNAEDPDPVDIIDTEPETEAVNMQRNEVPRPKVPTQVIISSLNLYSDRHVAADIIICC